MTRTGRVIQLTVFVEIPQVMNDGDISVRVYQNFTIKAPAILLAPQPQMIFDGGNVRDD